MCTLLCVHSQTFTGVTLRQGTVSGEKVDDPVVEMRQLLKSEQHTAETVVREATGDGGELPEDAINAEFPQTWRRVWLLSGE